MKRMHQIQPFILSIAYTLLCTSLNFWDVRGENILKVNDAIRCAQEDTTKSTHKCLSFDNELDTLVKEAKMIYITMPAKAAGTSFTLFTHDYCLKNYTFPEGNYFSIKEKMRDLITANYDIPPIISSHLGSNNTLTDLVKGATDNSLIIYVHRNEHERTLSAIRQVAARLCDKRFNQLEAYRKAAKIVKEKCVLREIPLHEIILEKKLEIGNSGLRVLNCEFYDAVVENKPKIVFMNYKQANRLQFVLAKHKCPELLQRNKLPIHFDDPKHWKEEIYIKRFLKKSDKIPLTEWLQHRENTIEWAFKLKKEASCGGKLKDIEEAIGNCQDETIQLDL